MAFIVIHESTIPLNEINFQIPPSIVITTSPLVLPIEDSLIMGNEELNTILEKESDEFIKSSVEDLVPIPITPLSNANEDCFDSGGDVDEINDFKDDFYDSEGDILYLESLRSDDSTPNLSHEVFLDRDLRSLSDAPIDNLMSEDKIF
nr:hypothetical protein [Tanacetum cinerariifolium]